MDNQDKVNHKFAEEICKLYDIIINLAERLEKIEKFLCNCEIKDSVQ